MIIAISGCATSPKVQVVQTGDHNLSTAQLREEIAKIDNASKEVDSKKGMTGKNVAAAVLFWPALMYTHMDANDANRLLDQRRNHLTALYNQKMAAEGGRKASRH